MRFDLTVNEFTRELAIGNELLVFDADTWRPYCHVRDFSRLIAKVLEEDLTGLHSKYSMPVEMIITLPSVLC